MRQHGGPVPLTTAGRPLQTSAPPRPGRPHPQAEATVRVGRVMPLGGMERGPDKQGPE
jgi:hypothetical protein